MGMLAGHYDKTSVLTCSVRTRLLETTLAKLHLFMPNTRVKLIKPLRRGDESNARTQTPPLSPHVLSNSTQHSKRAVKYLLYWYFINLLFCLRQQWSFNVEPYRFLRKSKTEPFLAAIPSPCSSWVSYGDIWMNRVSKVLNSVQGYCDKNAKSVWGGVPSPRGTCFVGSCLYSSERSNTIDALLKLHIIITIYIYVTEFSFWV